MGITVGRHTGILGVVLFENVQSGGGYVGILGVVIHYS